MSKHSIKCNSCGSSDKWLQLEFKQYGVNNHKGIYEIFRCEKCGQIRTQVIEIKNEQSRKVVIQ